MLHFCSVNERIFNAIQHLPSCLALRFAPFCRGLCLAKPAPKCFVRQGYAARRQLQACLPLASCAGNLNG